MAKRTVPNSPQVPSAAKAAASVPEGMMTLPAPSHTLEVPGVYANTVEILSMNYIDVRIAFNEVVVETGNQLRVERRANVVMPVPAFMMIVQVLNANARVLAASQQKQAEQAQGLLQAKIQGRQEQRQE